MMGQDGLARPGARAGSPATGFRIILLHQHADAMPQAIVGGGDAMAAVVLKRLEHLRAHRHRAWFGQSRAGGGHEFTTLDFALLFPYGARATSAREFFFALT